MKKNKGYTLIEMVIVIAIMAILSGLSAVSISLIRKAKAQDAVTTFNSHLSKVWLQTKSLGVEQQSMYCQIQVDTAGVVSGSTSDDYVYILMDNALASTIKETGIFKKWNKYVDITYTPEDASQLLGTTGIQIKFDKSTGAVLKGAGQYTFKDKAGNVVATVYLDAATGNHYIK